jgi:hypothetical protein
MSDIGIDTLDVWAERLMSCTPLTENEVKQLCDKAREVLIEESNVQPVRAPVSCAEWDKSAPCFRVPPLFAHPVPPPTPTPPCRR